MKKKKMNLFLAIVTVAIVISACKKDDDSSSETPPAVTNPILGNWRLTKKIVYKETPDDTIDYVSDTSFLGYRFTDNTNGFFDHYGDEKDPNKITTTAEFTYEVKKLTIEDSLFIYYKEVKYGTDKYAYKDSTSFFDIYQGPPNERETRRFVKK